MYFWMYPEWYPGTPFRGSADDPTGGAREQREPTVDESLLDDVAQALLDDPAVTGGIVDLRVQNGVAILDGDFGSEAARMAAVAVAASVPGIRDVCDVLVVTGAPHRH